VQFAFLFYLNGSWKERLKGRERESYKEGGDKANILNSGGKEKPYKGWKNELIF